MKDFTNLPLFPRAYSTVAHLGRTDEYVNPLLYIGELDYNF